MTYISPILPDTGHPQKIAVIGSGISGASAAWALSRRHDVTLFESESRFGGHTATVDIEYDGTPVSVDTGFIVYNTLNYPLLTKLFETLGVETKSSDMSFALSLDGGALEWSGDSLNTVFGQRRNLVSPSFLAMLKDVLRFNRICVADRDAGECDGLTIGDYITKRGFSAVFRDNYLIPMSAAIWSTPRIKMLDFPARTFIDFFANHRLINQDRPLWRTVAGGSRNYLAKLLAVPGLKRHVATPVEVVMRDEAGAIVTAHGRAPEQFAQVVIATHSDQALKMLIDADDRERSILGAVGYGPNHVVLHRDVSLMPKTRRCWASWNALRSSENGDENTVALTYWMNRLQGIDASKPLFVTLNPPREPAKGTKFGEWSFEHPLFDLGAIEAQKQLPTIQGKRHTWFAGAWTKYGFHEDGLRSGLDVARALKSPAVFDPAYADEIKLEAAAAAAARLAAE
jgi:uncharacterized protein